MGQLLKTRRRCAGGNEILHRGLLQRGGAYYGLVGLCYGSVDKATEIREKSENYHFRNATETKCLCPWTTFCCQCWVCLHSNVCGGLRKTCASL